MNKIVFLDRDGVINVSSKGKFLNKLDDLEYIDGSLDAIKILSDNGYDVYVITNQAGVAYGYISETELNKINNKILSDSGNNIKGIFYCPHSKELNCECRKPKTKLCYDILCKYSDKDFELWMVGDAESDIEMAKNICAKSILVLSGITDLCNIKSFRVEADIVVENLDKAINFILK